MVVGGVGEFGAGLGGIDGLKSGSGAGCDCLFTSNPF